MARYREHFEFYLALLWETVLGEQKIDIAESFFDLGGDRGAADRMLARVASDLGVTVAVARFTAEPTIEALATRIREARRAAGAPARPLRVPGTPAGETPLVFLHTVEGELMYSDRILTLDLGVPVLALRSVGMELEEKPLTSVDAMADRYVAQLDDAGVRGPYLVVGVSSSGVVALEMARRWEDRGDRVAYLGLFEPPPMREIPFDHDHLVRSRLRELCEVGGVDVDPGRVEQCVRALRAAGEIPQSHSVDLVMRQAGINASNILASYAHEVTGRFNGPAVLYESRSFGCGGGPVGTLADPSCASNEYERFWSRYLSPRTVVRRQNCDHRAIDQTRQTREFIRDDIALALGEINRERVS